MELIEMYPAAVNSKATTTLGVLNADTVTVEVLDGTVLPDAPNLLVLGTDQTAETVLLTEKDGNTLTIQRAVQGAAKSWPVGTQIARNFTAKDWNDLLENINNIVNDLNDAARAEHSHTPEEIGALGKIAAYYENDGDIDVITDGVMIVSKMLAKDCPIKTSHIFIIQLFFSSIGENSSRTQIAFPYNDAKNGVFAVRTFKSGSGWSGWNTPLLPDGSVPMSGSLNVTVDATGVGSYSGDDACAYIECFKGDWENRRQIVLYNPQHLSDIKNAFNISEINSGISKYYNIFGEHNKPSGYYTGNGSAKERIIDVGGIGYVLVVLNNTNLTLAWDKGGITLNSSTGTVTKYSESELKFLNGTLTIATTNGAVNYNGSTYFYSLI